MLNYPKNGINQLKNHCCYRNNGTWVGMFGMLQRNEIDIILGPSITVERAAEFDPTFVILTDKYVMKFMKCHKMYITFNL